MTTTEILVKNLEKRELWVAAAAIALCTVAVFWPLLHSQFVDYDDDVYVTTNPPVLEGLSWSSFKWALTARYAGNWHPLTWWSHMLDCQWYGLKAGGHHLTNLLLHVANSILVLWVLYRMTGAVWSAALSAALFALHPLHVESVAWVAERKDVLSALFFLLTLLAYLRYTEHPGRGRYGTVAALFALGLMAKPMLVTLPIVLLLLDYWPLRRVSRSGSWKPEWKLLREKIPLLILALLSSAVTFVAQRAGGAVQPLQNISFWSRFSNAVTSYAHYIYQAAWPARLAVFYPHPGDGLAPVAVAASLLFLAAVTAGVLTARTRPYLAVGWFWYLGTLVPVIGLVQVGDQASADRYTYIPLIGIFVAASWALADAKTGPGMRRVKAAFVFAALLTLAFLSRVQAGYWRDSSTLFLHAIDVVPNNYVAHNNLGFALARSGRLREAIDHYRKAILIRPTYIHAHNNLGAALSSIGEREQAQVHFAAAMRLMPGDPDAHVNMGIELAAQGSIPEAVAEFQSALRAKPDDTKAHYNLGLVLAGQGRYSEAISHYQAALAARPGYPEAHMSLGVALSQASQLDRAIDHYNQALALRPDYMDAHVNLGIDLARQGDLPAAVDHFRQAARIDPGSAEAHFNLAKAYLAINDRRAALEEYRIVQKLNPSLARQLDRLLSQ